MTSGVKKIPLTALLETIEDAVAKGLTPLVVDRSADAKCDTFFSYRSSVMLDGKKMGLDKSLRGVPVPEVMEGARAKLVSAIKLGYPLVISMQTSVTDFMTTFTDEAIPGHHETNSDIVFPRMVFQNAGKDLLLPSIMDRLFREEEKECGVAYCRGPENFYVILTTQFSPDDFEEYLFGNEYGLVKPSDMYQFIVIEHPEGEAMIA